MHPFMSMCLYHMFSFILDVYMDGFSWLVSYNNIIGPFYFRFRGKLMDSSNLEAS